MGGPSETGPNMSSAHDDQSTSSHPVPIPSDRQSIGSNPVPIQSDRPSTGGNSFFKAVMAMRAREALHSPSLSTGSHTRASFRLHASLAAFAGGSFASNSRVFASSGRLAEEDPSSPMSPSTGTGGSNDVDGSPHGRRESGTVRQLFKLDPNRLRIKVG